MTMTLQAISEKIQTLDPEHLHEVEHFVDYLRMREQESDLTRSAAAISAPAFASIWNNPEDDVYDAL